MITPIPVIAKTAFLIIDNLIFPSSVHQLFCRKTYCSFDDSVNNIDNNFADAKWSGNNLADRIIIIFSLAFKEVSRRQKFR